MELGLVTFWWAVFLALGVIGFPISAVLFRTFPDRGAGLSQPIAILALAFPMYWIGHLSFTYLTIMVGVGVLLGLAYFTWDPSIEIPRKRITETVVVFTIAFLVVIAIRSVDPSIHPAGGEKFLDYGLLNTVLRTTQLPPEDVWFAGKPVQYYYGGYLITGVLSRLTWTPAAYTYNLALAGFYGMLLVSVYSLACAVTARLGEFPRSGGLLAVFFVGFASNLVPVLQVIIGVLPDRSARWVANQVAATTALDAGPLLVFKQGSDYLYYWRPSRVIPGTVNEFPLFSWLNGDLQAHMMSTPFLVLAIAVLYAYYRTPENAVSRRRLLIFGILPLVIGSITLINTWDFPSALGLTGVTLFFAQSRTDDLVPIPFVRSLGSNDAWYWTELKRLFSTGTITILVACLGLIWVSPFVLTSLAGEGGLWSLEFVSEPSGIIPLLIVHGWMLLLFGIYLWAHRNPSTINWQHVVLPVLLIGLLTIILGMPAVVLVVPLIVAGWTLIRQNDELGFETVLLVAGACIVLFVEVVYLNEQAGPGRFNTVFKSYMHVWIFWGIAAGIITSKLRSLPEQEHSFRAPINTSVRFGITILVVSLSIYGIIALGAHFNTPADPTLDATTWASNTHPEEMDAINWLATRSGQPTIVSAPGCRCHQVQRVHPYQWVNAPSTFTGIPTVAGWSHQIGYRGSEPYLTRVSDVNTIYTGTPSQQRPLLTKYQVEYIWVSENERVLYDNPSFENIESVEPIYTNNAVTIYEVDLRHLSNN